MVSFDKSSGFQTSYIPKEPLFDKIIIKAGNEIPEDVDVRGCIAFTRDTNKKGFLHKLIYVVQKILAVVFRKGVLFDPNMMHGVVVLDKDKERPGRLLISHAVKHKDAGIKTQSTNHLGKSEVTEMVFYRPRQSALRELIVKYGYQTAFPSHLPESEQRQINKERGKFSITDMMACLFVSPKLKKNADKRIASLAADLLLGNQLKSVDGKKQHAFFCTPYATSVLQGSLIINALSEEERGKLIQLQDRAKVVDTIFKKFQQKTDDPISKAYWNNDLLRLKSRFSSTSHACEILNTMSQPGIPSLDPDKG